MRDVMKTVFLAQLNGQTPTGLSKKLDCTLAEAKRYIDQFFRYYIDVLSFLWLLRWRVAITGQTETWAGRTRTITAHRWMIEEPRVRVLLTYKCGDKFWYDISPIRPSLRVLTAFVHSIWSVRDWNHPKLIYTSDRGRIGTKRYASVDDATLFYRLPCRNLPWRSIWAGTEARQQREAGRRRRLPRLRRDGPQHAISATMQGGTSDLHCNMALRSQPVFQRFGAMAAADGP